MEEISEKVHLQIKKTTFGSKIKIQFQSKNNVYNSVNTILFPEILILIPMEQCLFKVNNKDLKITSMVVGQMPFLSTLNRCLPIHKCLKTKNECYTLSPYSFEMYGKYILKFVSQFMQKDSFIIEWKLRKTQHSINRNHGNSNL